MTVWTNDEIGGQVWSDSEGQQQTVLDQLAASDGSSLVGFVQSGTGAIARDLQSKNRERVSLLDFIPTANHAAILARTETADLAVYIQAAVDACNSKGGAKLFAPSGLYPTSAVTLKREVCIEGEFVGPMNAHASGDAGDTFPTAANTRGATFIQHGSTGDVFTTSDHPTVTYGCGLRNIAVIGKSGATSGRGVYFSQGVWWSSIENCAIARFADQGAVIGGIANTIEKNFIGFNVQQGASSLTFYKGNLEVYGTDHFVSHNQAHGPENHVVFDGGTLSNASLYACAALVQAASCFFHKNVFEIADSGLVVISRHPSKTGGVGRLDPYYPVSCHSNNFTQNRADFNLGHGIWLISTDSADGPYLSTFNGNWCNSNGRATNNTYDGIREEAAGANYPYANTLIGNTVFDSAGGSNELKYGINTATAEALQSINNRTVLAGNRVHAGSVQTAKYNTTANYFQGVVQVEEGVKFPATQISSSDVNTLDDYEEGTFIPTLTFATPGDVAVTYTIQVGRYTKIGNRVHYSITLTADTFSQATAAGAFRIAGLPFPCATVSDMLIAGACSMQGWTKANYTNTIVYAITGTSVLEIQATGSGQARATLAPADLPNTAKVIVASGHYETA